MWEMTANVRKDGSKKKKYVFDFVLQSIVLSNYLYDYLYDYLYLYFA